MIPGDVVSTKPTLVPSMELFSKILYGDVTGLIIVLKLCNPYIHLK